MADAYATLADGGERLSGTMLNDGVPAPISICRVTDAQGNVLLRNTLVRARALQTLAGGARDVGAAAGDRARHRAGGGDRPAGGRQDRNDDQLRRRLVLRLHAGPVGDRRVGYPDSQREMVVRGIRVAGGTFPAQIWNRFAAAALAGVPAHAFPSFKLPPAPSGSSARAAAPSPPGGVRSG